jgi:chorismate mutase
MKEHNTEEHDMSPTILDDPAADATAQAAQAAQAAKAEAQQAADGHISQLRSRIDEIDATLIKLWLERAAISHEVGATRVANGGTRLVLAREQEILNRFREGLGADGTQLAMLILRAGRGPLV